MLLFLQLKHSQRNIPLLTTGFDANTSSFTRQANIYIYFCLIVRFFHPIQNVDIFKQTKCVVILFQKAKMFMQEEQLIGIHNLKSVSAVTFLILQF